MWDPQGPGQGWEKRENPRVESKFSLMLQMVFGHQMQMRALQLANPQLSCQKRCQQSDTPSSPSTSVGCTKKWIYGKRYHGWNSCQTSPGSITEQHLSSRKQNLNKLKHTELFQTYRITLVFPHSLTPHQLAFSTQDQIKIFNPSSSFKCHHDRNQNTTVKAGRKKKCRRMCKRHL